MILATFMFTERAKRHREEKRAGASCVGGSRSLPASRICQAANRRYLDALAALSAGVSLGEEGVRVCTGPKKADATVPSTRSRHRTPHCWCSEPWRARS